MTCYIHPDREAIANCSVCGRPICSECYVEIGGSPYCKNCINALLGSDSENVEDESNTIENIEPITKPKTIPYDESSNEINSNEASEEIIAPIEKAPENYEPEYDYQTQYVESYGDEDLEDSYYENPESIPEPQSDYKEVVADKVFSEPNDDLESKYEKYLDDIYYDEVDTYEKPVNNQYAEPVYSEPRNVQYREPVNNQYVEPEYNAPRNQYREPVNNQYVEPVYQGEYIEDDYIVPVHQQSRGHGQSYEEIKRKLDAENMRVSGQRRYDNYPRDYDDYGRRAPQNLDDIQRMHYPETPKKDNSFTTVEIILTVILIILIIVVVFYIIYLFALSSSYSTVMDAVMGLVQNPSLFMSNLLH